MLRRVLRIYDKVLGLPSIYERVRPLIVGGIDHSPTYEMLYVGPDDVVLDVGCGAGDALNYLPRFRAYVGFDIDEAALARGRERAAKKGVNARFENAAALTADALERVKPTRVMLGGLLHHVDDAAALSLLRLLHDAPSVERITTIDIVWLRGEPVSNFLAALDRGRFCRRTEQYVALCEKAGWSVEAQVIRRSAPVTGLARYLDLALVRGSAG